MDLYTLRNYVNLDVDDTFGIEHITYWFNKGIANYNLIAPISKYKTVILGDSPETPEDGVYYYDTEYPLGDTFMLGVMLPFIASAIKGQEASITEKQYYLQEFMVNATNYKKLAGTPVEYMLDQSNLELDIYKLGENVFLADFRYAPFQGNWSAPVIYNEVKTTDEEV